MKINRPNMENLVHTVWNNCSPEGEKLVNLTNIVLLDDDIDVEFLSYERGKIKDFYYQNAVVSGFASNDVYRDFRTNYEISIKKLEKQREVIISILDNLSDECFEKQPIDSFMLDKQGDQWTYSHDTVYKLVVMGIGLRLINWYSEHPEFLQSSRYHNHATFSERPKYTKIYFKLENEDDIQVNLINKSKLVDMIYYNCSFQFWDIVEHMVPGYSNTKIEYFEYFRLQLKRNLIEKILAFNKKLKLEQDIQKIISRDNSNSKSVEGLDNKDELLKLKLLTDALNSKRPYLLPDCTI